MRIASTIFFTTTFLGATINAGWCPEPANLGKPLGSSTGVTAAAGAPKSGNFYDVNGNVIDTRDPKNMTPSQRALLIGRERQAGRITNAQEQKNFLQTGDAHLSYTPPPPQPLSPMVKPASMPEATWQRLQAERSRYQPQSPTYVRGNYMTPGANFTMEQNATRTGGKLTPYTAPVAPVARNTPPPAMMSVTKRP